MSVHMRIIAYLFRYIAVFRLRQCPRGVLSLHVVVLFSAACGLARGAEARQLPAQADIRFQCTSTLHDFEGAVPAQPFVLSLSSSNTWSAQAAVVVWQMNTASEGRDRNMWKMFGTNNHPLIRGEVKPSVAPPAGTNVTLTLTIRDQKRDLSVQIIGWTEDAEAVRFHAAWDVSLKQYGLKPPTVMGIIRVGDNVHVEADVTASKMQPLTDAPAGNPSASSKP
jgi:polyisoprenoid-binding protein YceI